MKEINQEKIKVKFVVDRISYHEQETLFTVIKATFKKYNSNYVPTSETVIIGNFVSVFVGDEYEAVGHWDRNPSYGYRFILESHNRVLPSTQKGIRAFLAKFVKGIGNKTANAIVDYFKEETFDAIEGGWKNIVEVGITEKKAKLIYDQYMEHRYFEKVAVFVLSLGGGYKTCLQIYEALSNSAIKKIMDNPYCLCSIKIDFLTADKFAKQLGTKQNCPERIKHAILYYIERQMSHKGHLYVARMELYQELNTFLEKKSAFLQAHNLTPKEIDESLSQLEEEIVIEKGDKEGEYVYLKFFNFVENRIVSLLQSIHRQKKVPIASDSQIQTFISDFEKTGNKFAKSQKDAIFMALQNGISILTGTPGTGKTQTINSIIKCVKSVNPNALILLSAPTGKASKRITELTGMEARTIHRLIGLNGANQDKATDRISADLLIVDESSMIDAYVFYELLSAVDRHTRLLLVGDYEQLPSVGAGLILRDLINSGIIPVTRLTEVFRQAKNSQIVMNAKAIIEEKPEDLTFDNDKRDCYFMEVKGKLNVQTRILECLRRMIENGRFSLDDIQVLVPQHSGVLGTNDLNRLIQAQFNTRSVSKKEVKINAMMVFREGDKVMQIVNNYDLGVFNGEVGRIVEIVKEEGLTLVTVDFGDKEIVYDYNLIEELELAYSISIHKAQGSEFPCVIMPIHESQEFMLNKNLIYTGLTRAKETVVIIGQKELLYSAIKKNDNTIRNSQIKEKLIDQNSEKATLFN